MFPTRLPEFCKTLFAASVLALCFAMYPSRATEPAEPNAPAAGPAAADRAKQMLRSLPLAFEPNMGQAGAGVDFVARSAGYSVALTASGMALRMHGSVAPAGPASLAEALNSPAAHDLS